MNKDKNSVSRRASRSAAKAIESDRRNYLESSSASSESEEDEVPITRANKRNRPRKSSSDSQKKKKLKQISESSNSEENSDDDDDDDDDDDEVASEDSDVDIQPKVRKSVRTKKTKKTKKKSTGRRKIKNIIGDTDLQKQTREAAKEEKERLRRLEDLEKSISGDESEKLDESIEEKKTTLVLQKSPLVQVSEYIAQYLRPHQLDGVRFIWNNLVESTERVKNDPGAGCILAHCMGLGKTLQTIASVHTFLKSKHLPFKCAMVVAPLSTVRNWIAEFVQWCEDGDELNLYNFAEPKTKKQRIITLRKWRKNGGVLILGYDMYRIMTTSMTHKGHKDTVTECLIDPGPDIVVCDEGHILKNATTNISKQINKLKTRRRLVLTGTPLQNNLIEYHCMVDFVKPDLLGSSKEFRNRFVNPIVNGQHTDSTDRDVKVMKKRSHVLHQMLEGFVQRKDYSVLTPYLSSKFEYVLKVRLTPLQIKLYQHYLDTKTNRGANNAVVNSYGKGASLFADYQNLMRVWTHPKSLLLHTVQREKMLERQAVNDLLNDELEEISASDSEGISHSSSEGNDDEKAEEKIDVTEKNLKNGSSHHKKKKADELKSSGSEDETPSQTKKSSRRKTVIQDSEEEWKSDASSKKDSSDKEGSSSSGEESSSEEEKEKIPHLRSRSKAKTTNRRYRFRGMEDSSEDDLDIDIMDGKSADSTTQQWYSECFPEDKKSIESYQNSSKITIFFEILKLAEERCEKVLVFSQSLISLDLIEEMLNFPDGMPDITDLDSEEKPPPLKWYRNIDYFRMDGSTQGHHRQRWINAFNDEDDTRSRLFLISTRAGSLGVNLVGANRVVIFDASWNPSHDTQSMFRVYRFGQKKKCYIYRLIAEGTMEEKIYQRQVNKQSLAFRVVDEQQINRHFTAGSLAEMYAFNPTTPDTTKDAPTPIVPKDDILADILLDPRTRHIIASYHEHDSLLDHQVHEELTEEERKAAWDEYEMLKTRGYETYDTGTTPNTDSGFIGMRLPASSNAGVDFFAAPAKVEDAVLLLSRLSKMVANSFYQYQVCEVKSVESIMKHLKETPLYRNSNAATIQAIATEVNYRLELQRDEKYKTFQNLQKQFKALQEQYFKRISGLANMEQKATNSSLANLPSKDTLLQQMASTSSTIPTHSSSSLITNGDDKPLQTSTAVELVDLITPEKEKK